MNYRGYVINQSCAYSPVEQVNHVEDKIGELTRSVLKIQREEIVAACNRFFPQGFSAAKDAGLIFVDADEKGITLTNYNGAFICFAGEVESTFSTPNSYSRLFYSSSLSFKFKAFDGKTTRD